jgi:alkylhydroperoxidase family enzyme
MVPGGEPCRRADQRDPRPEGAWWETRLFSDAEQAALQYADALTRASDTTVTPVFEP